jgi:hypothetical protein
MSFDHKEIWDRLPIAADRKEELYYKALKIQQEEKRNEIEKKCCNQENSEVDATSIKSTEQKTTATCGNVPSSRTRGNDL